MTADDPPVPPSRPRQPRRLLSEAELRQRFRSEVADYTLAVRAELVTRFGDIDTYSRLAAELKRHCPYLAHYKIRDLARRRAEHFNNVAGPPWLTVEEVLHYVVSADRREPCRQRFEQLYTAARHKPPPDQREHPTGGSALTPQEAVMLETLRLQTELGIRTQELLECRAELRVTRQANVTMIMKEASLRRELLSRGQENRVLRRRLGLAPDAPIPDEPTPYGYGQIQYPRNRSHWPERVTDGSDPFAAPWRETPVETVESAAALRLPPDPPIDDSPSSAAACGSGSLPHPTPLPAFPVWPPAYQPLVPSISNSDAEYEAFVEFCQMRERLGQDPLRPVDSELDDALEPAPRGYTGRHRKRR